jgi:uncharacterized protein YutE (UPF0331/DUF86 family)
LAKLDEYLVILERLARYDLPEFLADPERYGSAERFLQLAIEGLLDMGSHVVAELALGEIESYGDIPRLLQAGGHIRSDLAERWVRMIGLRNILVHEYLEVDRKIVHEVLRSHLGDLEAIGAVFVRFL